MKAAIITMTILLLPAALFASSWIGVYFTYNPGQRHYTPMPSEQFAGYVYAYNTNCYVNGVDFRVIVPPDVVISGVEVPGGSTVLGDPVDPGLSIIYWPPLNGWYPGYNLLCTLKFFTTVSCHSYGGTLIDALISIVPTLDSGSLQFKCWPDDLLVQFTGGDKSILCPELIATQAASWGAIKSLF